jgi:phosphate-selective porin OprO/OprP
VVIFKNRLTRRLASRAAIALAIGLAPLTAVAQSSPDRFDAIEQHLRQHDDELRTLKQELGATRQKLRESQRELGATRQQLRESQRETAQARAQAARGAGGPQPSAIAVGPPAAAPAGQPPSAGAVPPGTPGPAGPQVIVGVPPAGTPPLPSQGVHVLEAGSARFGIESADGRNAIFLTGRLHFDIGDYLDYKPGSKFAAVQDLNSGTNARRARLGVVGRFMQDWDYTFIYDLGGSGDGFPPDPGALTSGIENALVTYNGLKNKGVPLVFDIGYMDVPFSLEESNSSNDVPLVERAAIINVATNIFANDFRSALGARSFGDDHWAGLYLTGPTSGTNHTTGEQVGVAGRAGYNLWHSRDGFLHLEANAGALLKPPAPGGVRSITLSDRPELRVDPTTILNTGALGTAANPLNRAVVYGVGGAFEWHNFVVSGEYFRIDVDRQGLATNTFDGGYIEGIWVITGEQRRYSPPSGGYLRPVPEHMFLPWDGSCCGAFELAARYSTIDLNDRFTPGVAPTPRSNAVGGGQQTVYAAGLNWYPNANIRFMFDFLHGTINKRFSAAAGGGIAGTPLGAPVGGEFNAVVMRTQVAF